MKLEDYIDQTYLKNTEASSKLVAFCLENKDFGFKSLCIPPYHIAEAKKILEGTKTLTCTVIGFPLGYNQPSVKEFETIKAIEAGADEIDMVINISHLKEKNYGLLENDIKAVTNICLNKKITSKVIIETCLLTKDEIKEMCKVVHHCGADFIKTSTGFSTSGAYLKDIELMKSHAPEGLRIKASGGIRDKETAVKMIEAGADRLGTSSGHIICS